MTALLAALARELFGWSLVGLRAFTILASAGTVLVGALVARELGATRRAQTLAAVMIGFSPGMLATNLLFQPVALDQLTTMIVLWLALRLALGRGSWPLLGSRRRHRARDEVHARRRPRPADRDVPRLAPRRPAHVGLPAGRGDRGRAARPEPRLGGGPRLDERALVPQPAAERERRDAAAVHRQRDPARAGGVSGRRRRRRVARPRSRAAPARLDGRRHRRRVLRARRQVLLRAAGAAVRARRRCDPARPLGDASPSPAWPAPCSSSTGLLVLPISLPVLPLHTAVRLGVVKARGDYQSEVGWPAYVRLVERHAAAPT